MNKYGLIALEYWKTHAPSRYETLENPETYFATLGESAAAQVDQVAETLERRLPPNLPYLERVGQINAIRLQAEELVLQDLVYSVTPEPTNLAAELEEMIGDLPTPMAILEAIDRIREQADDQAGTERFSTSMLTSEQEKKLAQLTALLPLVSLTEQPDEMTEPALRDRILALRPYWDPETRSLASP